MKIKQLNWDTSFDKLIIERNSSFGFIEGQKECWFEIRRKGKKVIKYFLYSYPIMNQNFARANHTKILGEFNTPEEAAEKAQEIFNEFVQTLVV